MCEGWVRNASPVLRHGYPSSVRIATHHEVQTYRCGRPGCDSRLSVDLCDGSATELGFAVMQQGWRFVSDCGAPVIIECPKHHP